MFQQFIPSIRTISAKATALFTEIDDAFGQHEPDREHIKRLQEKRLRFLAIQGTRALLAMQNSANQKLEAKLPSSYVATFVTAIELLKSRKVEDAYWQIIESAKLLIREVDYASLSVQEAAIITCLISDLAGFSDAFIAYRSNEPAGHHRGVVSEHAVEAVANQGGRIEDLVSLLAEVFYDFGQELGAPNEVSAADLQSLLTNDIESENLPGIFLAIWAVTRGHLVRLNDAIQAGVASLAIRTKGFDNATQQSHPDN